MIIIITIIINKYNYYFLHDNCHSYDIAVCLFLTIIHIYIHIIEKHCQYIFYQIYSCLFFPLHLKNAL